MVARRCGLRYRLAIGGLLALGYAGVLGWWWLGGLYCLYALAQAAEYALFTRHLPRIPEGRANDTVAIALLLINSTLFGAPTLMLTQKLGSWGDVCATYMLCGVILHAVLTTIGCRAAFRASVAPFFAYIMVLPFNALARHDHPTTLIFLSLSGASLFLVFNIAQLWQDWSTGKAAESHAVRRYIAERDANEARLFLMTQTDGLSGLLNRDVLQSRLADAIRANTAVTLLMIDLDGFKYVNDTLGHSSGDVVLREISRRIQALARAEDSAARLGGDEFALLVPGVTDAQTALSMATSLITMVSQPVWLAQSQQINIGASVGIALHPLHGDSAEDVFANADLALYQAKAEGRHCARVYTPALRALAHGKIRRDTELRNALDRSEFEIFYQPQVRMADGGLAGAEALLRWRHPEHGLLGPASFLAALEGGLLSAEVGAWAIRTACRQAAAWRQAGLGGFRIGVNLFGAQFRSGDLVEWVTAAYTSARLPPEALEIEITENVILRHEDEIIGPLQELRNRGVGVAFDDYGTGFASLSMLTRYPVSRLKIDQRFTRTLCENAANAAIVHAVIQLAEALKLRVTAEGIETAEQAAALQREGCDEGQGYFYGPPMSAAEFARVHGIGARPEASTLQISAAAHAWAAGAVQGREG